MGFRLRICTLPRRQGNTSLVEVRRSWLVTQKCRPCCQASWSRSVRPQRLNFQNGKVGHFGTPVCPCIGCTIFGRFNPCVHIQKGVSTSPSLLGVISFSFFGASLCCCAHRYERGVSRTSCVAEQDVAVVEKRHRPRK